MSYLKVSKGAKAFPRPFAAAIALAAAPACGLGTVKPKGAQPAPQIVDVLPSSNVQLESHVAITLSAPVMLATRSWPVVLVDAAGTKVPFGVTLASDGRQIDLAPADRWPSGQRITIEVASGFVDAIGQELVIGDRELAFTTVSEALLDEPMLTVRSPLPGSAAPLNLRTLAVAVPAAMLETDPPGAVVLEPEGGGEEVTAEVERSSKDGVLLARLPQHRGACDPLCPQTRYRIALDNELATAVSGTRGEVETATVADDVAPVLTSTAVLLRGDRVTVEVDASEPVVLRGEARGPDGAQIALQFPLVASECTFVESLLGFAPDTDYTFVLEGEDQAGNLLPAFEVRAHTLPSIRAAIQEIVPVPAHDWGDSDGLGVPFDAHPGGGVVSAADQWVELVNLSDEPIDLASAGLVLKTIDSSPTETIVESAPALYFGDGGSRAHWWPGEALVVRPRGGMAQRGFVLELSSGTQLLDRVAVGSEPDAVMRSARPPDLEHEALARGADGRFHWCQPTPGDPLPNAMCL